MEFKIKVEEVLPQITLLSKVVASKGTLPILDNIMIEVVMTENEKYMVASSSDANTYLKAKCNVVDALSVGKVCIDAKTFVQTLANLSNKEVTMVANFETHTIHGTYGNGSFKIPFCDADDFPPMQKIDKEDAMAYDVIIDAQRINNAINAVRFCVGNDELRPQMSGIHFDIYKEMMCCAATDGHKLAKYTDTTIKNEKDEVVKNFTLPTKPALLLSSILTKMEGEIRMMFDSRSVSFSNEGFYMITRLCEGRYPNYDAVIPKNNNRKVVVNRSEVEEAIRRVTPLGSTSNELVALEIKDNVLTIKAEDVEFATGAEEHIECEYDGEPLTIGFKGSFLLQSVSNIGSEKVIMEFEDYNKAGIFRFADSIGENLDYLSLLMPLMIS